MPAWDSGDPAGPRGSGGASANAGLGGGFGGGGGGGNGFGGGASKPGSGGTKQGNVAGTGLKTGKDVFGNTAFGKSGAMATGYAMGPASGGWGAYGNFRDLNGNPVGALGTATVQAPNALQAYQRAMSAPPPAQRPAPLSAVNAVRRPVPQVVPVRPPVNVPPPQPTWRPITREDLPAFFRGPVTPTPTAPPTPPQRPSYYPGYNMKSPTGYPQFASGWRRGNDVSNYEGKFPGVNYQRHVSPKGNSPDTGR